VEYVTPSFDGILLVNFGSPQHLSWKAIFAFLYQIFSDHCPSKYTAGILSLIRTPILFPRYQALWTPEGSPLVVHSNLLIEKLSQRLNIPIKIAMYYSPPSIPIQMQALQKSHVHNLLIVPLFPHPFLQFLTKIQTLAETTAQQLGMSIQLIDQQNIHNTMLSAWSKVLQKNAPKSFDHLVMSFHSIPHTYDTQTLEYKNSCESTMLHLAKAADIPHNLISIGYQSAPQFGRWLGPTTLSVLEHLVIQGKKRILLMTPSFITDCLETLWEVDYEYARHIQPQGTITRIPSLNSDDIWVQELGELLEKTLRR
jgi:ferrochelatase